MPAAGGDGQSHAGVMVGRTPPQRWLARPDRRMFAVAAGEKVEMQVPVDGDREGAETAA